MTLLPDLPPARRPSVPQPPDGVARAVAAGRARRARALSVAAVVLATAGTVAGLQVVDDRRPVPAVAAAGLPPSYLALSYPVGAGGPVSLELRSPADGALLRTVPATTAAGDITSSYALGGGDAFLVRRPGALPGPDPLCGGTLVRVDAGSGTETEVLTVPEDRSLTALAVSAGAVRLAYGLSDCSAGTGRQTAVELRVRDLTSGRESVASFGDEGVGALSFSPDDRSLLVLGTQDGAWGASRGQVLGLDDLGTTRAELRAVEGCGLRGAGWGRTGLHAVESCGQDGDDVHALQEFAPDGTRTRSVPLPACSLGAGASADPASGQVLVWVNATGDCAPMNRLLVLRDGRLRDLPRPSQDRLYAATW